MTVSLLTKPEVVNSLLIAGLFFMKLKPDYEKIRTDNFVGNMHIYQDVVFYFYSSSFPFHFLVWPFKILSVQHAKLLWVMIHHYCYHHHHLLHHHYYHHHHHLCKLLQQLNFNHSDNTAILSGREFGFLLNRCRNGFERLWRR